MNQPLLLLRDAELYLDVPFQVATGPVVGRSDLAAGAPGRPGDNAHPRGSSLAAPRVSLRPAPPEDGRQLTRLELEPKRLEPKWLRRVISLYHIYIYIERERERERDMVCIYIYIYIYIYVNILCMCIYIYIYIYIIFLNKRILKRQGWPRTKLHYQIQACATTTPVYQYIPKS